MTALPPRRRRRRRRALFAGLAAACGLLLALGLLEAFLRLADPLGRNYEREFTAYRTQALQYLWETAPQQFSLDGRLYWHKPDLDLDLGSFRLRTNALGCRGPAVAAARPDGVFRIAVLGDSVAFGWGVDDEHTFVRRLENEWNAAGKQPRLEVVNLALPMYDTVQELAALREVGLGLRPDLVLLVYVVNDVEPTRDVVEEVLQGRPPHPEETVAVPHDAWSAAAALVRPLLPATAQLLELRTDLAARIGRTLPPGETYRPERFGKGPRGWPRSQEALRGIRDACRTAGVPLLLLDHTLPRLPSLPEFCRAEGIDCEEFFFSAEDHSQGILNSPLDPHANARGHALLLQRLQAILAQRGLLPR